MWPVRLAVVLGLLTLLMGFAAPPGTAATAACESGAGTACINGTLRTSEGEPVSGALLTITGEGLELEATSREDGTWDVTLEQAGEYTVLLDTATLPEGESLREGADNPRTVAVELGRDSAALFPLVAGDAAGAPSPSESTQESAAPTSEASTAPAVTDTEGGTSSESAGLAGNNRVVQLLVSGLVFGILLALASVGANLIYGTTGLSNFAHGDLVTLGGVLAFVGVQWWGMPLWLAIVMAVVGGCAAGWLLDAGVFAPLRRRGVGVTQQLIVTIGIALAMLNLFLVLFGANPLPIVTEISTQMNFGLFSLSPQSLVLVAVAVVVLIAVALVLQRTRLGRATRAVSDNPPLAAASGINVSAIVRGVWVSAAGLAALGGALMGLYLGSTRFNFGSVLLLLMFAAITLGGLGSPMGGLFGAIVIGIVVEMSTLVLPNDLRYATALGILIIVLLVRPQGILGRAQRIG